MTTPPENRPPRPPTAMELLDRVARGEAVQVERMPQPDLRSRVAMRDGARLDTHVWLPSPDARPAPAILMRTPYGEFLGWKRLGLLRYVEDGYAVVLQLVRGVGASEGHFTKNSPFDRTDGYDTVEWVAAQPWCSGAVGMDGGSYVGMTQITCAAARPPHLKCIAPIVPSSDHFLENPYWGGIFFRLHSLNWTKIVSANSLEEISGGFVGAMAVLAKRDWMRRLTLRPAVAAAEGLLEGDFLAYYRDVLAHPTFDDFWRVRQVSDAEYARIDIPVLAICGHFDPSIGTLKLWRKLETLAGGAADRRLLIGPWDHGTSGSGAVPPHVPYEIPAAAAIDVFAARKAFFDLYLKGKGAGPELPGRVSVFITGANRWLAGERFPLPGTREEPWHLRCGGRANTVLGDGALAPEPPAGRSESRFVDDPAVPLAPVLAAADERLTLDLREVERQANVLVYSSTPLAAPLDVVGEPRLELETAADQPDADLICWLAEARADGRVVQLSLGTLRLRYREGFDREVPLAPGEPVLARFAMTFVGHRLAAGSRVRLLVAGSFFPFFDPNTHSGEPVASAVDLRVAVQRVMCGGDTPSRLLLPVLAGGG